MSTFGGGGSNETPGIVGEVALRPGKGGVFVVGLNFIPNPSADEGTGTGSVGGGERDEAAPGGDPQVKSVILWDRKVDGGFPETKLLKQRVRDFLEPGRDLGHVDRVRKKDGV